MWRGINAWVEVKRYAGEDDEPFYDAVIKADELIGFGGCNRWKTFLLGYEKYGPCEFWSPEKPLRGIPDDISQTVSDAIYSSCHGEDVHPYKKRKGGYSRKRLEDIKESFTWYTLSELKAIDWDEDMGIPETPDRIHDFKYCVDIRIIVDDEEFTEEYRLFTVETLERGLEEDEIDIDVVHIKNTASDEEFYFPLDHWKDKLAGEDHLEKVGEKEALLRVSPIKKRVFKGDFDKFIEVLDNLREQHKIDGFMRYDDEYNKIPLSDDEIRLVLWQKI